MKTSSEPQLVSKYNRSLDSQVLNILYSLDSFIRIKSDLQHIVWIKKVFLGPFIDLV